MVKFEALIQTLLAYQHQRKKVGWGEGLEARTPISLKSVSHVLQ